MIFRNLNATRRLRGYVLPCGAMGQRLGMTELDQTRATRRVQENDTDGPLSAPAEAPAPGGELPRLSSRTLFRAAREIIIEHDGADYRLRLTTNGKLILTK